MLDLFDDNGTQLNRVTATCDTTLVCCVFVDTTKVSEVNNPGTDSETAV